MHKKILFNFTLSLIISSFLTLSDVSAQTQLTCDSGVANQLTYWTARGKIGSTNISYSPSTFDLGTTGAITAKKFCFSSTECFTEKPTNPWSYLSNQRDIFLSTTGNVGIGTNAPTEKLTVSGGHVDTKIRLSSTGDGGNQPSNLSLWASEPGWTYAGTGLGYNVKGSPYYGRIDAARGSSFVRFLPGETKFEFQKTDDLYTRDALVIKDNGSIYMGVNPVIDAGGGWHRSYGNTGWYNGTYGGGFWMTDTSWIRTYNNKSIWTEAGLLGSNGGLTIGYGGAGSPSGGAIIAGNVGIGTTAPGAKLDVVGDIKASGRLSLASGVIQRGGSTITSTSDLGLYSQISGNYMRFVTNNAPFVFFSDSGPGTTPIATIQANGNIQTNGNLTNNYTEIKNGGEPTINFHRPGLFASGIKLKSDNRLWFGGWSELEGNLGIVTGEHTINNTAPTIKLIDTDHNSAMIHVNGNLMYFLSGCGNNRADWCVKANSRWPLTLNMLNNEAVFGGRIYGQSYGNWSDIRLKENITHINSPLSIIKELNGYSFTWKESKEQSIGFIAQEVEKVVPSAVSTESTSGMKGVDYSSIIPITIEGIKELSNQMNTLERQNQEQQTQIEKLENEKAKQEKEIKEMKAAIKDLQARIN